MLTPGDAAGMLGRRVLGTLDYTVDVTVFTLQALKGWFARGGLRNRANRRGLINQLIFTGVDALPTLSVLGIAVGIGVVAQLIMVIQLLGSEHDVLGLLVQVVVLEFGSLLTAILVIGRTGSAITVDLGQMSLNREIDGLQLLGVDVVHFLVAPRVVGAVIAQLVLAVYFSLVSVVVGVSTAALLQSPVFYRYLYEIPQAVDGGTLATFVFKNLLFGLIIGAVSCFHGLKVGVSATELPQQGQRAVVNSMILVFVFDGLITLAVQ